MSTATTPTAVANYVWNGGEYSPRFDLEGDADAATALADVSGQFALHGRTRQGAHVLARDALGVNKLFFALTADGEIESSNYWFDLVQAGRPPSAIWSVPAGRTLRIVPEERALTVGRHAAIRFGEGDVVAPGLAAGIRRRLEETFVRLGPAIADRPLYVTLSGGLDSTSIAALARKHLGPFTAVTFVVDAGSGEPWSDDLAFARRVADDLGVRLLVVPATGDELLAGLDEVLVRGQDWRDFNVHCGVVNRAIARAIRALHAADTRPVVLTGDTMNELMADYSPVTCDGREYYTLPRLDPGRLRRFLVQGLDAGDREVGIFAQYGVDVIQPYALCADAYAAVPAGSLRTPDAKQRLVRDVLGSLVPSYIYERRKVRAQVGSEGGSAGVLGVFARHGVDSAALASRYASLFSLDAAILPSMIRAGVYRFPDSFSTLEAS